MNTVEKIAELNRKIGEMNRREKVSRMVWTTTKIGGQRMYYGGERITFFVSPSKSAPGKWHVTAQQGEERYSIGEDLPSVDAGKKVVEDLLLEEN